MIKINHYNEIFHQYLDDDIPVYFAELDPPSLDDVARFEELIGCQFPDDFKCMITNYCNGFYAEAKEDVWPRRQGGAYWMFQYGLMVYGLDSGCPDWINLRDVVIDFRKNNETDLTPCMKTVSSADPYCFTPSGELVKWDHETWKPEPVNTSFFEAFRDELKLLNEYKEKAKKELA